MKILSIEEMLQISGGENKVNYEFRIYASYIDNFQEYINLYKNNEITAEQLISYGYKYYAPNTSTSYTVLISI